MVKINRHIFLGNATENDVGTAIDAVQLLPLIYLGSAEPSPISYIDVLLSGVSPLTLTDALADGLNYLKLFGGTELVPETYLDTVTLGGGTELVPETYLDTVTLSGGCEQRNLPSGYTQIEYLESSGTQYIDTGIVLKSEATITTVGQNLQSVITGGPNSFWGFMGGTNNLPRWGWSIYQNRWLPDLNMTTGYGLASDTNKHTFVNTCYYENNVLKYDSLLDGTGTSVRAVDNVTTYTNNTLSAYLFARNNDGTAGNFLVCRIFSCEIVQDSIKVLSLIPCRRNSDNVLGMYDTVTGNFLTNSGTGTFTAGSDTVPTPDYPMDIWCNNGILKASPNLFNKSLVPDVNEYVNRSNGNAASPTSGEFRHSDYITIKENAQYYVGIITSVATSAGLAFYDDTKTYISGMSLTELGNNNNIITSPNDTKYIRFSFRTDEGYNTNWQNTVYFVEGNQPLAEFMPYGAIYTDGTVEQVTDSLGNTTNAEMLLSVGDYVDTQEVLSGNVTRNVGIKVLDGTENWNYYSVTQGNLFRTKIAESVSGAKDTLGILCNAYTVTSSSSRADNTLSGATENFDFINNNYTTLDDWEAYLATQYSNGTPVIIVYPLAESTTETVSGQVLTKSPVTQTAGAISGLTITTTESAHTTPTPTQPLDIICNNGVLKYNNNIIDNTITGQGTFVSPSTQSTRIYKYFGKLPSGNYTLSITGGFQFIVQYRDVDPPVAGMAYGNIGTWETSGTYTLDNPDYFYGIAIRYPDNSNITPSDFNGTITLKPQFVYIDGTQEVVDDSLGNIASAERLLAVGDYVDTQEVLNGGVTRNISIKVLDGTESWEKLSAGGTYRFGLTISDAITISSRQNVPITHFHYDASSHDLGVGFLATGKIFLYQNPDWTVEQFKQWLADQYTNGTPVIVAYPLATATTSSVSGQFLSKSPVTQTAGSISNLPITVTESSHTTPTPTNPLDINCNNGVLKLSPNLYGGSYYAVNAASSTIYQPTVIQGDSWTTDGSRRGIAKIVPVKGNTTYTFSAKSLLVAQYIVISQYASIDDMSSVSNALATNGGSNLSYTVTTDANAKYVLVGAWAYPTPEAGQTMSITEPQFELGSTATPYIPYGQIYADGITETVEVTGKNLFNKNTMDTGNGYYVNNGVVATSTANRTIAINCKPNTKYSFWHTEGMGGCRAFDMSIDTITEGDSANWITQSYNTSVDKDVVITMTTSANAKKLYICAGRIETETGRDYTSQLADLMVVEGEVATATPYEAYYNGGSATAEMLLKVSDYKDVQSVLDGDVTRNVGIKVLDGSEEYAELSTTPNVFRFSFSDNPGKGGISPICSHYQTFADTSLSTARMPDMSVKGHASIDSLYYFKDSRFSTSGEFKEWLATQYANGTPVIIVYPLAEPATESVTAQPLTVQTGTNIVTITQASIDDLTMELSYKQKV